MQQAAPIQADLVLVGGGHAHVTVLKSFGMNPVPGLRLTLITDVINTPYSGMLPAHIEGVWDEADMHIDLVRLAEFAGARFIHDRCTKIDPHKRQLTFAGRPPLRYDLLSLNSGAAPATSEIEGADEFAIPVKPISGFLNRLAQAQNPESGVAVIGGGAAAVELALSLRAYYRRQNSHPAIHLMSRTDRLMPRFPARAHKLAESALQKADITIHSGRPVTKIDAEAVYLNDGTSDTRSVACDVRFLVTAARAPDWIADTCLACDEAGYIKVKDTLQTPDFTEIFAVGDVASIIGHPREKAGVFAVRSGPALVRNLRAFITGQPLRPHKPQSRYLALLGLADGTALAIRGQMVVRARVFWHLKQWIDKRFMDRFSDLPEMQAAAPAALTLPHLDSDQADPSLNAMRCYGCAAKTGADSLSAALKQAVAAAAALGADPARLPGIDTLSDSAHFTLPEAAPDTEWLQTTDSVSQMVSDPFLFGRISALHAMSDIFVAGGVPKTALATIQLAYARQAIQQDMLTQILTGALLEFSHAGVQLVGGHTSEATDTSAGFAILGIKTPLPAPASPPDPRTPYSLILTKPLGIGILLAAHMRTQISADAYDQLLAVMLQSNQQAALILRKAGCDMMTDVTGFGLARHCLSLLQHLPFDGAEIWLDSLPVLPETLSALDKDITSSLHQLNAQNLPIESARTDNRAHLLYDPQSSGGIVAIVKTAEAESVCAALHDAGYKEASIIGKICYDGDEKTAPQLICL